MVGLDYEHSVMVTFSNRGENKDLNTFLSLLKRINKEAKKSGFRSMFSAEEKVFIRTLHDSLIGEVDARDSHVFSDRASVQDQSKPE